MNKSMKNAAQAGFTLIELIVVIVILGILAATALPRFSGMTGDARVAALQGARGALASTSALAHGRFLVTPGANVIMEGTTVTLVNGYPAADIAFMTAAGLDGFKMQAVGAASSTKPLVNAGELVLVPSGIDNTATAVTCFIRYTEAVAGNPPVISSVPTTANCE